jgi:hypothetical protein
MKIVLFYHSLLSDWNHGNAHFLRGVTTELLARGHDTQVFEPRDAWSLQNLLKEHGQAQSKVSTLPTRRFRVLNTICNRSISTQCCPTPTLSWCTSGTTILWYSASGASCAQQSLLPAVSRHASSRRDRT